MKGIITKALNRFSCIKPVLQGVKRSLRSNLIIYLLVSTYIIIGSVITILKEKVFLTSGYDLGIFNQAFWTTRFDNRFFYETGDLSFNPGGSFFGVHFSPIMILILPFYSLYPAPETLLVIQTLILAVGAIPVYWMGRDKLGQKAGIVVALIYLMSPLLLFVNLNDFHLEALSSTFFLFSIYYLQKEKWGMFSISLALALSTIEFAPIIALFMAFYALLLLAKKKLVNRPKAIKYIIATVVISILWFIIALYAKSFFNPGTSPIPSPFHNLLQNPIGTLISDFQDKMFYIIALFGPLAFLPFLAPEALIMLIPWMSASLFSVYTPYYSIYYQYQGFVIPFLFTALIISLKRINFHDSKKILTLLIIPTLVFSLFLFSAPNVPWNYHLPVANENTQSINEIMQLIPNNASIMTQNDLFPQISGRTEAYMFLPEDSNISVEYILCNIDSFGYRWRQPDIFGERSALNTYIQKQLEDGSYGVYASAGPTILFKKEYKDYPVLFKPYTSRYNFNNLTLNSNSIRNDQTSTSKFVLFHNGTDPKGAFWHGPYANLAPGLYKVTYALKANDTLDLNPSDQLLTIDVTASSGKILLSKNLIYGINVPSSGQWFNATIFFGLTIPTDDIEFRGNVAGDHNIILDYIELEQISPKSINFTDTSFNYGDLSLGNGVVSEGVMTHLNGTGTFWYGPYISLPKGNYTADFWLKLDSPYNGDLMELAVTSNSGKILISSVDINSANFTSLNKWQNFKVNFSIPIDSDSLEFPGLNVWESAPISFLIVYIHSDIEG